jgi:hypothetical protein
LPKPAEATITEPHNNALRESSILTCPAPVKNSDSFLFGLESSQIAATGSFLTVLISILVAAATIWKYSHFALKEKTELRNIGSYFRTLRFLTESRSDGIEGLNRLEIYD